jgi:hypothetical protein
MPIPGSPLGDLSPDEQTTILELLVLRHLYEGDIVDWPLPDDHPDRALFNGLQKKGWIARWDRIWPLRDRYRLTEAGIAEIERQYDPAKAEAVLGELRKLDLKPRARAQWLRSRGYDPTVWPTLHDPYTHWETWRDDPGPNFLLLHHVGRDLVHREVEPEPRRAIEDLDSFARDAGGLGHGVPFGDVS